MSYHETIQIEAKYADNLGFRATGGDFNATYHAVLCQWFPTSRGYIIDPQVIGEGEKKSGYFVVRSVGGYQNPLLIVKLNRPSEWTAAGKDNVQGDLRAYIEGRSEDSELTSDTIYGVVGIGLHWTVYKMDKSGGYQPVLVLDWQDNIASDSSYIKFESIANLVYSLPLPPPPHL